MTIGAGEAFQIHPQLADYPVHYDRRLVLPPDTATVSMAFAGINTLYRNKTAQLLYDGIQTPTHVVDLGAGSGVIDVATLATVKSLDSLWVVDNDPAALAVAQSNIENAQRTRLAASLGNVSCNFIEGDWHDPGLWEQLPPADLTLCNPPYLISGEQIRAGYEDTPASHLFAANEAALLASYEAIVVNTVSRMRTWDTLTVRLPRGKSEVQREQWLRQLYERLFEHTYNPGEPVYYLLSAKRYPEPHPDRPLRCLIIEKLPLDYPTINPTNDARVDHYMRCGKDLGVLTNAPKRDAPAWLIIEDII